MQLSAKAINDLKDTLSGVLGSDFCKNFNDNDLNDIGLLILNLVSSKLKISVRN